MVFPHGEWDGNRANSPCMNEAKKPPLVRCVLELGRRLILPCRTVHNKATKWKKPPCPNTSGVGGMVRNEGNKGSAPVRVSYFDLSPPYTTPFYRTCVRVRERPIKTTRASIENQSRPTSQRGLATSTSSCIDPRGPCGTTGAHPFFRILWAVLLWRRKVEQLEKLCIRGRDKGMSVYPDENTVLACGGSHCASVATLVEHYSLR